MNTAAARVLIMQAGLPPADVFLLIRILDMQGLSQGACTLSAKRLAADCGLHRKSVDRSLARLEKAGWLLVERAAGKRARRRVLLPADSPAEEDNTRRTEGPAGRRDPPDGGTQVPAGRRVRRTEGPAPRRDHPPPDGGTTSRRTAGSYREHDGEHDGEHPPYPPLGEVRRPGLMKVVEVGEGKLVVASKLAMRAAIESQGGDYQGDDRAEHIEVGRTAAPWAAKRGLDLREVLAEWALEWVRVAQALSARSWKSFALAKAAGRPWAKGGRGRASGVVVQRGDPADDIPDVSDSDVFAPPPGAGEEVIGYG